MIVKTTLTQEQIKELGLNDKKLIDHEYVVKVMRKYPDKLLGELFYLDFKD